MTVRKIFIALVAGLLLLTLAACGDDGGGGGVNVGTDRTEDTDDDTGGATEDTDDRDTGGGGGGSGEFCAEVEALFSEFDETTDPDPNDLRDAIDRARDLDPPSDVEDEYNGLLDVLEEAIDVYEDEGTDGVDSFLSDNPDYLSDAIAVGTACADFGSSGASDFSDFPTDIPTDFPTDFDTDFLTEFSDFSDFSDFDTDFN